MLTHFKTRIIAFKLEVISKEAEKKHLNCNLKHKIKGGVLIELHPLIKV
jgi:hypothetical protein